MRIGLKTSTIQTAWSLHEKFHQVESILFKEYY